MATWKAEIKVMLKEEVLDPQGSAINKALQVTGHRNVEGVRMGKYLELSLTGDSREELCEQVEDMCERILANPVIENYRYYLREVE